MAAEYEYYAGTVKAILRAGDDSALGIEQHDAMAIFSAVSWMLDGLGLKGCQDLHYRIDQRAVKRGVLVEVRERPDGGKPLAVMTVRVTGEMMRYLKRKAGKEGV